MPSPASGGAAFRAGAKLSMRLTRKGCTNRPFYHIVIHERRWEQSDPCIEQVGTYDPLPNTFNEKLVSLNLDRIKYWIGEKIFITRPVGELLGLSGLLPIHPYSYMTAWRNRREALEPELPLPAKLTWRERKRILLKEAEEKNKEASKIDDSTDKMASVSKDENMKQL